VSHPPASGSPLLQLLDAALDLAPEAREAWLQGLDASQARFVPRLRSLLARAAAVESSDFLGTLPALPTDPRASSPANVAGTRVGPYRLERQLGAGGMGTVWLAHRADGLFERAIALKLPHRGLFGADLSERMARERSILATLEHPHIARLYDAGLAEDGQPFLALEYVEGQPIDEYCRAQSLSLEQRLKLFLQVADAVAAAHARLIVHRDLKPANIMVTREGYVRLLDFGIAKLLDEIPADAASARGLTQLSVHAMTPDYASPEQILGQSVTIATDVYSLGVVLYELLTGNRPYRLKRDSRGALEDAVLETEPARPSATDAPFARELRGDLDTITLKALRKKPEDRYATVNALAEDIRRHLAGMPVLAQPDSAWYRTSRFVRRNRVAVGVSTAVALALVGAAVTASVGFVRARAAEQRALAEAATSREVARFLVDLFKVSDPGEARGNSVTAREMLDRAALRIRDELAGSPVIRAELQQTMADVYGKLGLYDQGVALAQASLVLRRSGADPLKLASALEQLAEIQNSANRASFAIAPLDEALELRRRHAPDDRVALARTLQLAGASRFLTSNHEAAFGFLTEAHAELSRLDRPDPEQLAGLLKYTAYLHHERADYAKAISLYREAVGVLRDGLGSDHPALAGALGDLAVALKDVQQFAEAERHYLAALDIQRRTLGPQHRDVGDSLNNLSIFYMDLGDFAKGHANAHEAARILMASLGPENDLTCTARVNATRALTRLQRYDEAERELTEVLAIRRRTLQPDHLHLIVTIEALANNYNYQRQFAKALPLAREASDSYRRTLGPESWRIFSNGRVLGVALTGLGRYPEAEQVLLESHRKLVELRGPTQRTTLLTATRLAELYEAWGKPGQAKEWRARSQP
jgi:serine/threonine protein kinase/tetratricopeptide (TPR) repeat protein